MVVIEISCVEVWRELSEFIDGTLDSQMHERLVLHLSRCAHCKAVYDGTLNTVQLIGDDEVYVLPTGFGKRLLQRIENRL